MMAMNLRLIHGHRSFQGPRLAHRMASRDDARRYNADFPEARRDESSSSTDVLTSTARAFVSPNNRFAGGKELHPRQQGTFRAFNSTVDKHHRVNGRPEYTSLADVYEKSLRNVLNIQLHLKLDDQATQETLSAPLHRNQISPPHPRGVPYRDYKLGPSPRNEPLRHHRCEEEQRLVTSTYSLQGRTELRVPRRITSSEGSAFHVPSKRQSEIRSECERRLNLDRYGVGVPSAEYPLYSRAAGYPSNRIGLSRESSCPYGTPGMYLTSSHEYLDSWHKTRSRDVPPLFPVRCTPVEQRTQYTQAKEYFSRTQRGTDLGRINGFTKDYRGEGEESLNPTSKKPDAVERRLHSEGRNEDEHWPHSSTANNRERLSESDTQDDKYSSKHDRITHPPSPRYKPYSLKVKNNSSPINAGLTQFKMFTRYRSALKRNEGRKGTNRSSGHEGAKEEFLSKLGLGRVEQ